MVGQAASEELPEGKAAARLAPHHRLPLPALRPEIRQQIIDGKLPHEILLNEKVGEIKAQIIERDGQILMVKDCPIHGHFEDVMSIDPPIIKHLEEVFPGRDIRAHNDEKLHNHGTSTVTHGRGSVLTIDLTNRCNMMCDPCFMDANQVGFVHELTWDEIKTMLDNAVHDQAAPPDVGPVLGWRAHAVARTSSTPSPTPARSVTTPSRPRPTASSSPRARNSAKAAAEAGLRYAYLQFDGIGNAANSHRKVGNSFDVKLQAIHNLHEAGVDIVPVTCIINGINNEQVGRIIEFALDNPKKINFLSFQPVSFTGRDEDVSDERRAAQRYTLSHLAHDVKNQTGLGESTRDWFPISFMSTFSDWADLVHGPDHDWGQLSCGCHPNCGIGMALMIDKETKEAVPVTAFLNADRLAKDVAKVNDAARGKFLSILGVSLALLRNYEPAKAPTHFKIMDLLQKFDKCFGATGRNYGKVTADRTMADIEKRRADRWNFLFIAGMWFQDLFNYDFRRTEQCIIPYATQEGEISFCAYNTGVGWRNIIEKMHMTSTLTKWYEEHGRHEIFAGGKKVAIEKQEKYDLVLNDAHVNSAANDTFEKSGIAKNAREEKIRARDAKLKQEAENARMAKLYRKEILKEPETPGGFVAIGDIGGLGSMGGIKPATPVNSNVEVVSTPLPAATENELVAGD